MPGIRGRGGNLGERRWIKGNIRDPCGVGAALCLDFCHGYTNLHKE